MNLELKKKIKDGYEIVKNTLYLIIKCAVPVFTFVIIYALFNLKACVIVSEFFAGIAGYLNGVEYICPDNAISTMLTPTSIIISIIMCVCFSFISIFEIAGLMHAYSVTAAGKKVTITGMINAAVAACEKCIHPKNWLLIVFIIVIYPLTGFITLSSATFGLAVPEFVIDFLFANQLYKKLTIIVYIILVLIEAIYIFSLNFFVLGENNFVKACKESRKLIHKHFIETIICVLLAAFTFYVISTALAAVLSDIVVKISKVGDITGAYKLAEFITLTKSFFNAVFSPILNVAVITSLFFKYINEKKMFDKISKKSFVDNSTKSRRLIGLAIVIVIISAVGTFFDYDTLKNFEKEMNVPEIVAHRGDSVRAPENTMPAIELAALENNTYIEFDVHRTKDGKILVSHDDNLLRVTGKDVNMHEITYDEAMQLDTGKWFNKEYEGTKFSLLSDVLKFLKDYNMTIQVEIKPSGHGDSELEHDVVDIIRQSGIADRCMITCLKIQPLIDIEKFAPDMTTIYSMFVAWGNVEKITEVDGFTIEEENITESLVNKIHKTGRKCFVWTVNTENKVQYFVDCGVDGILTDDPIMMRNALVGCDYGGGIKKFFRMYISAMIKGL